MNIFLFSFLLIISKILFVYALYNFRSYKSILVGVVSYALISWSIFYTVLPLTEFKAPEPFIDFVFIACIVFVFSLTFAWYALFFILKNIVNKFLKKIEYKENKNTKNFINYFDNFDKKSSILKVVLFASILTLSELLISVTLSFINSGSYIPDYAFTNVGYALAYSPFIFMAKYVHVYGLTFILGLIIAALSEIETNKKNVNIILKIYINKKYFKLLLFVLFFSSCFIFYKNDVYNQKVIGGDQSSRDRLEVMLSDSRVLVKKEDAGYIKILNKNNVNTQEVLKSYDLLVDGETRMSRTGMYNVSHVYDNINGVEYTNYKRFLMPFGEYLPHFFYFLKYINSEMFEVITARHTYTSVDNNKVWTYDGKRYATLLCSDAWSPVSVRDIKKQNPDVVILQRSERLFKNRSIYIANVNMWKMVLVQYIGVPVVDVNK